MSSLFRDEATFQRQKLTNDSVYNETMGERVGHSLTSMDTGQANISHIIECASICVGTMQKNSS
jgi:hypothetical protein